MATRIVGRIDNQRFGSLSDVVFHSGSRYMPGNADRPSMTKFHLLRVADPGGLVDEHLVAGVEQGHEGHVYRCFRPSRNEDFRVGIDRYAEVISVVAGKQVTKLRKTAGMRVVINLRKRQIVERKQGDIEESFPQA